MTADEPADPPADEAPSNKKPDEKPLPDGTVVREGDRSPDRRRILLQLVAGLVVVAVVAVLVIVFRHSSSGSTPAATPSGSRAAGSSTVAGLDDSSLVDAYIAGTTSDIAAVTSYDYRYLDTALSTGESVTTGAYKRAYRTAITGTLATQARRTHRVQDFEQLAAGIGTVSADGDTAKVLIFGEQSVTDDTTHGRPRTGLVTLTATMQRSGDSYLIADLAESANAGLPPASPAVAIAAEAARESVAGLLTVSRAHFAANLASNLDGAVRPLSTQLKAQAAAVKTRLTRGRYDLTGTVTAIGVEQASAGTVVLLVAATGFRVPANGKTQAVTDGRYEVTVVQVSGHWLTSEINPITAS